MPDAILREIAEMLWPEKLQMRCGHCGGFVSNKNPWRPGQSSQLHIVCKKCKRILLVAA
jgi:hypothetical protein